MTETTTPNVGDLVELSSGEAVLRGRVEDCSVRWVKLLGVPGFHNYYQPGGSPLEGFVDYELRIVEPAKPKLEDGVYLNSTNNLVYGVDGDRIRCLSHSSEHVWCSVSHYTPENFIPLETARTAGERIAAELRTRTEGRVQRAFYTKGTAEHILANLDAIVDGLK